MPHFCAVKTCTNTAKPGTDLSFHRLPVREPERLKLWLFALDIDIDTPSSELKKYIVCSEHFLPEDYTVSGQPTNDRIHRFLTPTAVPTIWVSSRSLQTSVTYSEDGTITDESSDTSRDTQPVSEECSPSSQQCDVKKKQTSVQKETEILEHPQVKEEPQDQCLSPGMESDTPINAEVRLPESEPNTNCKLLASSAAEIVNENDECNNSDGSSSPQQSHSIEVYVELEQPPREEKSCRLCGKSFKRDSHLIRHVDKSHEGHKAFKCMECSKEFEQRYQLVMHVRSHTGEKPFSCDFCDKTFAQNSSRLAHMRVHTGEKPYFCAKCGKGFATSNHLKICKVQNDINVTMEKWKGDESPKKKSFKCFECDKEFSRNRQLVRHVRVHTGEKPFSCDFCDKTFTQDCNRIVHMRQHTKEKPYFCEKCGKSFARSHHLKYCTVTQNKSVNKSFRCSTCGKSFHTDSELKVHMEVHESWKRHINEKLQCQEMEEKKT